MAIRRLSSQAGRSPHRSRRAVLESLERRNLLAAYTTPEDTPLIVSDPAFTSAAIQKAPEHGSVVFTNAGGFAYTPAANYHGPDGFTYVTGGTGSITVDNEIGTVSITVESLNDAPVAANDAATTSRATPLAITWESLLANDTDADGDDLKVALLTGSGPMHGTLSVTPSGSFIYVPKPDFTGADSFQYFAWDQKAFSAPAKVTITVKPLDPPPVAKNDFYSTPVNTTLSVPKPGVLANDGANDGVPLEAQLVEKTKHGDVILNSDGSFTYTPLQNFTGIDTFTYRATNPLHLGAPPNNTSPIAGNIAKVTITVKPLNPPPEAKNDFYTTPEGTNLNVPKPGVLANDSSSSNLPLTAILLTNPTHGTLTLNGDGSFSYSPTPGFVGLDKFVYQATTTPPGSLLPTTGAPTLNGSVATVTISVTPKNSPPIAKNDSYTTIEGQVLTVAPPGVLANDSGPDGHKLTAAKITDPKHGTLIFKDDGSFTYTPKDGFFGLDSFTYRAIDADAPSPAAGALALPGNTDPNGNPNLPIPIPGDIAKVFINVKPLNPPPIAKNDIYSTQVNTALTVAKPGVLGNDLATAGKELTASVLKAPEHGTLTLNGDGSFNYTPKKDFTGRVFFSYRASYVSPPTDPPTPSPDPATAGDSGIIVPSPPSDVALVTIYVTPIKPAVEAHNDVYLTPKGAALNIKAPGVLANDFGPAGHPLKSTLVETPQNGTLTLNGDGSFSYTPKDNFVGADKFTYRASDSTVPSPTAADSNILPPASEIATVTIYVLSNGSLPKFILGQAHDTTDESGEQKVADWATPVSVGPDGQPGSFLVAADNDNLFTVPPSIDAAGQLTYTPAPNASGSATVTVTLSNAPSEAATFTINVAKPHPLFNAAKPCDVTADNQIAPDDALQIINWINAHTKSPGAIPEGEAGANPYYDVNRDGSIAAIDALMVINRINAHGASGSATGAGTNAEGENAAVADISLLALMAQDATESTLRRRRTG